MKKRCFELDFFILHGVFSAPFLVFSPKKRGEKGGYFRFLRKTNATTAMAATAATPMAMAISVVISGASVGSTVSMGSWSMGSSGSIVAAGVGAGSTTMAVCAKEPKYPLVPSKVAMMV